MSRYKPRHIRKRKREFSKVIFLGISGTALAIVVFSCVMIWRTNDLTPLACLIPAVAAEMAAATGFYYTKAKAENQIKLKKLYGEEVHSGDETSFYENG